MTLNEEGPYPAGGAVLTVVVWYTYPSIIALIWVPLATITSFNFTVPWNRQGGVNGSVGGGVAVGIGVGVGVGAAVGVGVGVGSGVGVGVGVGAGVGVGVGVTYTVLVQPKVPKTSASASIRTNTTANLLILPPSLLLLP